MPASLRFSGFNIVVRDMEASAEFYGQLGFDVAADERGAGRRCVEAPGQHFDLDAAASVAQWNQGWAGSSVGIWFETQTRQEVDDLVTALAAAGHTVQQPAFDAPWGRRFAVVGDPDGNSVGLMSAS